MLALFAALLSAALLTAAPAQAEDLKFPALSGRVVDDAHVLPAELQASLTDKLKALEDKTSRQLVVVTVSSLQGDDIADYGYRLGRAWGIGQKGQNNGVLFIIAPNDRKVRIEVGYGMEGVLTDAFTSVIINQAVLPKFKAGDIPGGVEAGTDALIEQMSADPTEAEQKLAAAKAATETRSYSSGHHRISPISTIFTILFVVWVLSAIFGGRRRGGMGGLWPLLFFSSMMGRGGRDDDWGGGGGGWGGGGGGGFSGGGGSFGGGGSSGSW